MAEVILVEGILVVGIQNGGPVVDQSAIPAQERDFGRAGGALHSQHLVQIAVPGECGPIPVGSTAMDL